MRNRNLIGPIKEKLGPLLGPLLGRYLTPFLLWSLLTLAGLVTLGSLGMRLVLPPEDLAKRALEEGHRVVVHVTTGDMDGTPRHTKREVAPAGEGGAGETFAGNDGMAPAPLDTITEQSDKGLIPAAGKDGTLAWKYYARPYEAKEKRPVVAILLTNLGLSRPLTEEVLKLPHEFTLSFSPYAGDARQWARKARAAGFESLIDLPVEPADYPLSDPGPYGLLSSLDTAEAGARLHWVLSRFPGYVGTLAGMSEKYTSDLNAMRALLTELTARGVLFVYLPTEKNAALGELVATRNLLAVKVDAEIDAEIKPAVIEANLNSLVEKAKAQGYAVGVAHSYPPTVDALLRWHAELAAQGVDLVPLSAIGKKVIK